MKHKDKIKHIECVYETISFYTEKIKEKKSMVKKLKKKIEENENTQVFDSFPNLEVKLPTSTLEILIGSALLEISECEEKINKAVGTIKIKKG